MRNGRPIRVPSADEAEYIYKDEHYQSYLKVRRYYKAGRKQFAQFHWDSSNWQKGKPKGPHVPYRLPEMRVAAQKGETKSDWYVFVCEGEKDADNVAKLGLRATTNSEGAGKWRPELNKWFAGKTTFILPDYDKAGAEHAQNVQESDRRIPPGAARPSAQAGCKRLDRRRAEGRRRRCRHPCKAARAGQQRPQQPGRPCEGR